MAISLKTAGTWARMVTDNGTVAIPGTPAAGDRMFLFGSWKTYTITVADPDGWNIIDDFSDGTTAAGNGTGSVHNAVWYRDWQSGDAAPAIDYSAAPTEGHWVIQLWTKAGGDAWGTPSAVHAAIAAADPWAATSSATITVPDASVVMSLVGLRDDSSTIARSSTTAIEDDGSPNLTWNGNYVESPATHFSSTTGFDMAGDLGHRFVTTGAAGVNLTSTGDPAAAETGTVTWVVQGLFVADPQLATPGTASLALAAFAPTVTASDHKLVTPDVATLTLTAFAPTVALSDNKSVTPGLATLSLSSFAPTVALSDHQSVTPDVGSLVLSGFEPTVSATEHVTVAPDAAALVLATFAPSVAVSDNQLVTPEAASLLLQAFAATVTASDHLTVTPDTAALTLTTFAPDVTGGVGLTLVPAPASLALQTFAPSVIASSSTAPQEYRGSSKLIRFPRPRLVEPKTAHLRIKGYRPTVTVFDQDLADYLELLNAGII